MNNKMDKVADILGVQLDEIFHIVGHGNKQYLLSKSGYLCKIEEGGIEFPVYLLVCMKLWKDLALLHEAVSFTHLILDVKSWLNLVFGRMSLSN